MEMPGTLTSAVSRPGTLGIGGVLSRTVIATLLTPRSATTAPNGDTNIARATRRANRLPHDLIRP